MMSVQADLFTAPPAPPPAPAQPGEVVYEIVPKGDRFAINWRCGDQIGVVGGLYPGEEEAQRCIEFRRELRAQGIKDPRPWMRIPRGGHAAMTIPAYPLQWPAGWKRTAAGERARARFAKQRREYSSNVQPNGDRASWLRRGEISIAEGVGRIRAELARMGIDDDDVVINSNLLLRLDGFPRSGQREPDDPGIAVYWRDNGETRCMAIDRYDRVADNLAAVAATLDAMRAIERHGGAEILNRAFTGFTALPAPGGTSHWRDVLDPDDPEGSYRRLRGIHHPDRGGDPDEFSAVQHAWDAYLTETRQ